jgi:dTDP-4-amino-4,6-dideoxygalactose transaminase
MRRSRLDEIQAALLRVKLERLERWNERRRALAKHEELAASVISLPISPQLSTTACAQVCEAMIASVTAVGVDRPM